MSHCEVFKEPNDIYIYMSPCEVFKEPNDIYICRAVRSLKSRTTYIYVATSVTNFGAILFTPYMHGAVFCVAVDYEGQACRV